MNKRNLTILAIILCLGFAIELIKGLKSISSDDTSAVSANLAAGDYVPYSLKNTPRSTRDLRKIVVAKNHGFRLSGGPAKTIESYDSSEGHGIKVEDKKKVAKKAKKAKSSRGGKKTKETANKKTEDKNKETVSDKKSNINESNTTDTEVSGAVANPVDDKDKEPKTYEEWARLVLNGPKPEQVQALVEAYRSHKITSEVFYAILNAMLAEKNNDQQVLAVEAAGSVMETQSFLFLVQVLKTKAPGSEPYSLAQQNINEYKSVQTINTLKGVYTLANGDAYTVLLATQLLNQSLQAYLDSRNPADTSGNTGAVLGREQNFPAQNAAHGSALSGSGSNQQNIVTIYKSFEPILNNVATQFNNNSEVVESVTQALARIQRLPTSNVIASEN